ncbi:hypothetical protein ITJ43_08185 [Microbacterium sp. VKM Ac-2870]|uniref:hypothetical protein n=1 Tax=Microbacterium sp. VKM Ac-2870 TaxID=2783825 RepID=UPI00188AA68F|nr:hypothetical protein [Microbacterium sp. VKM Ac-2870]MBF4562119.1 hypothetical protein [Microbacterium sp. VKM Ac-2870]
MMTHKAQIDDRLELLPIDDDAWRLCDRRVDDHDAEYVVAYIERGNAGFEAIWMRGPRRRSHQKTLQECVRRGEALVRAEETSRARRPVSIAHFPPPRAGVAGTVQSAVTETV